MRLGHSVQISEADRFAANILPIIKAIQLIYTATAGSQGTLGGLVEGRPRAPSRMQALV